MKVSRFIVNERGHLLFSASNDSTANKVYLNPVTTTWNLV
jgi:hypothetical protein